MQPIEIKSDKIAVNSSRPLITIIIPVYNGEHCIHRCLSSVFLNKIEVPFEVIVVDDGSTDSTASIVQQFPCKLITIQRSGVAAARNLGIKKSHGEIIFFFDADVILKEDTIKRFLEHFREDNDAYVIQGRWDKYSPALTFSSDFFLSKYTYNFNDLFDGKKRIYAANLETGCLAVRREVFDCVGGFDEGYKFSGGEEHELGLRIMHKYKIFYYSELFVEHSFGNILESLKKIYRRTVNFSILAVSVKNKEFINLHKNSVPREDKISVIIVFLLCFDVVICFFNPLFGLALFIALFILYSAVNFKFIKFLVKEKNVMFAAKGLIANFIIMIPRLSGLLTAILQYYILGNKKYKI